MWQKEDLDLLISYSATPQSPVYTRRVGDPMGISRSTAVGGKKKLSQENLGEMFPHGETGEGGREKGGREGGKKERREGSSGERGKGGGKEERGNFTHVQMSTLVGSIHLL